RAWSDGARGSGAIKAHADVVVCQERVMEEETEVVYLGAFSRDEADLEPLHLEETGAETYFWQVAAKVPPTLRDSYDALKAAGPCSKSDAAQAIMKKTKASKATAYRHIGLLLNWGGLVEEAGNLKTAETVRLVSLSQ